MRFHHFLALLSALSLTLFFLVSCSSGASQKTAEQPAYRTGTQGLVMQFLPGTPPPTLFEGEPLVTTIEITNKGTFDVSDGRLYLSGFDPVFLKFGRNTHTLDQLPGKSMFNPDGLFSNTFDFEDPAVSLPNNADRFQQTLKATACYRYRTQGTAMVCIDPDPHTVRLTQKVCTIGPVSLPGGQGAPIAITKVEEQATRDRIQFKIFIRNAGGGDVIDPGAGTLNCHEGLDRRDIDKVEVTSIELSGHELQHTCEPNPIRLVNGQGYTFCTFEGRLAEEAFTTALNMVFDYGYRDSLSTQVEIFDIE